MASRRRASRPQQELRVGQPTSREEVRVRWISDGWYWGPACPQDERHGALLDLQGSPNWYCRHATHLGRGVYSEEQLIEIEWQRVISAAQSQEILPPQS
jgi:hypothetical protein